MNRTPIIIFLIFCLTSCSPKKSEEEQTKGKTVTADAAIDKVAEVTVLELKPKVFDHEIVSNGHLTAHEKVAVNFQTTGVISAIFVKNGQYVTKGQKLATLDIYKLLNQLAKDKNTVASARLEMQDVIIGQGYDPQYPDKVPGEVMKLARLRGGLDQAELALAATQREIDDATLTAPISGTIANLSTKPHNMTSASEPFCSIIDEKNMDVEFTVLESELPMVKAGERITITPFAGGEPHTGQVTEINPVVDENGMVRVWASVQGGNGLIDGMNVRVNIKKSVEEALVIPKTAVVLRSGRQVVFTLRDGKAMWNYVTTGLENLDEYTVTDGLEEGMTVIVSGNLNLAHESPVKVMKK